MVRHTMPSASNLIRQPVRNEHINDPARNVPPNNLRQPNPVQAPAANRHQVMEQANRRLQERQRLDKNRVDGEDKANQNVASSLRSDDAVSRRQRNLLLRSREENHFLPKRFDEPFEERLGMAAFSVDRQNSGHERRLEHLRRLEEKFPFMRRAMERPPDNTPSPKRVKRNCIGVYLADISQIMGNEPILDWIEYKNYGMISGAVPERLICSSLVCGNGELIMFGGLRKESLLNETEMEVSNAIHILTFPRDII